MAVRALVRFRAEDIWDTPENGNRYEVIDGELHMSPPPVPAHQRASSKLHVVLGSHVYRRHLGELFAAPIGVVLDAENGLQPDFIFVRRERAHIIGDKAIVGAPDLVVEVLSPSTQSRDRGIKLRRYAAAGVPHYWIVDPRQRPLETYQLTERGYERTGTYGPGIIFRPELFPGLEMSIDDLWS